MDELTRKIEAARHYLNPEWDADHSALAIVGLRRRARRRSLARSVLLALVVGASAGMGAIAIQREEAAPPMASVTREAPAQIAMPEPVREETPPQIVRLGDGSTLAPLTADSKIVLEQIAPDRIEVAFDSGVGRFDVLPNPKRSFVVSSGAVRVIVLGTAFTLERDHDRTRVSVDRGRARVEWPGGARDIAAGEAAWFPPKQPEREPMRAAQADPTQELLMAADAARLSGRAEDAAPLLRRIVDDHPRDPRAPLAAFTLGRVLLELGREREAAHAFADAARLDPSGSLAADARRREAEARRAADER